MNDSPANGRTTATDPENRSASFPVRLFTTLVIGVAGGFVADWFNVPLAWMLGPFAFCAVASVAGMSLIGVPRGRELGQVVVGLAIGLRFTPAVMLAALGLLPAMVVSTLFVVVVTMLAAFILMPLAGVNRQTAFFATAAAGMADMATVASQRGGDPDAVSIVHAIRVSSVVAVVPLLVFAFGEPGQIVEAPAGASDSVVLLLVALILGYAAAVATSFLPLPNPWLIGPIFLGAGLGAAGLLVVVVPDILIVGAQLMIGISLGCRFKRALVVGLPRVVLGALAISAFTISAAAMGAWVLSLLTGLPFGTSFLAVAPAAVTEMVITAKAMNMDAQMVTAFHVMRIAVIASTILLTFAIFERLERRFHGSRT
jgi:uncharacterized protein